MSFLSEETIFMSFSWSHFFPLVLFTLLGVGAISFARNFLDERGKTHLGFILALIPPLFVLFRMSTLIYLQSFDYRLDLPIHLCRITAFAAPIIMLKKHRFSLVILYFWIIVGTLNANITPDLNNGFPHFEYLCYFGLHSGLMILPFYAVFVYGLRVTCSDLWKTFFLTNAFFIVVHGLNWVMQSNYMYTMHKPASASIIDYLGPWPWYLLTGQLLVLILMFAALSPFLLMKKIETH